MFTRLRWFLYGVVATVIVTGLIFQRARSMKQRLDAEGVARVLAAYGADVIEYAGRRLQRSADRDPEGSGSGP
ncbi:MAG: hypothetical protein R2823_07435 [Acidimicrobiia bacterium]